MDGLSANCVFLQNSFTAHMNTLVGNIRLTDSQQAALEKIIEFLQPDGQRAFILKGYAGTGKTTLVKAIIQRFAEDNINFTLLASTGRAAKILSDVTREEEHGTDDNEKEETFFHPQAKTIHSQIYKFEDINQELDLFGQPAQNSEIATDKSVKFVFRLSCRSLDAPDTVYIIDESSMISDAEDHSLSFAQYGAEGRLLSDLFKYDPNGKFLFIGDDGQLPPVTSQNFSPALNADYLQKRFKIPVASAELKEVMRQANGNDIVYSAEKVRKIAAAPASGPCALFPLRGYQHIHILNSEIDLLQHYFQSIKEKDYTKSTLIVFSNKRVSAISEIIRPALGFKGREIEVGDLLLVTQNNMISGLMNGDLVKITQIGRRERRAGLTFVYVEVMALSTNRRYSQLLIEEVLYAGGTNLSQSQQTHLLIDFHTRMRDEKIKQHSSEYNDRLRTDEYLNALRCIFGYALTCHKAQGGEWDNVYLIIPRNLPYRDPRSYVFQWIYTAMTRAKKELYIINDYWVKPPSFFRGV